MDPKTKIRIYKAIFEFLTAIAIIAGREGRKIIREAVEA